MTAPQTEATEWTTVYVMAESAPIGVQLWPTDQSTDPDTQILNNVVTVVQTCRSVTGATTHTDVTWTYQSGRKRYLRVGDRVACMVPVGTVLPPE